jgi:hypothetical protein
LTEHNRYPISIPSKLDHLQAKGPLRRPYFDFEPLFVSMAKIIPNPALNFCSSTLFQ